MLEMRIVVMGNLEGFGGAQTACRRLIEFLLEEGHQVGLIVLSDSEKIPSRTEYCAWKIRVPFSSGRTLQKGLKILLAAAKARLFGPTIFISVGLSRSSRMVARALPSSSWRVAQDFIFGRSSDDPALLGLQASFDALAVQAPSMIKRLSENGFHGLPLNWLPCFPEPFRHGFTCADSPSQPFVQIAYFGRLAANKGLDLLLKAMAKLLAEDRDLPVLHIWGDGPERERLLALTHSLKLGPCVEFRGKYPDGDEGARLMCGYNGIVLPSTGTEGLPLILLEAMAYGLPLLTTNVGAIPDACMGNIDSIMVDPSIGGIHSGLQRFIVRFKGGEFSSIRIRAYYESNFGYDAMGSRWREMLTDPPAFFKGDDKS
ncbi:MAG: glycosyltransferase [Verrucomicrobiae bacterium]|nr:glycosyltransferase [Verrucomicrobiae bacterium]